MRGQEEILPFYTAATIISQALQEHTSWASWALNIGIWPIVNIIKRYKVDSLCTSTIKIWQKICLNFVIPARWCPWYYFWSGDCQAKRSPSLHFVPMYLKYIFIPLISLMHTENLSNMCRNWFKRVLWFYCQIHNDKFTKIWLVM